MENSKTNSFTVDYNYLYTVLKEKYTYLYYAVGLYYNTVFYTQENVFLVLKRSIENDQLSLYSIIICK